MTISPTDQATLQAQAKRRGLIAGFSEDCVLFLRWADRLPIREVHRQADGTWIERSSSVGGYELLATLPSAERAQAWLTGYDVREKSKVIELRKALAS